MLNLYFKLRSLTSRQEGQGMVEYALILVLVSNQERVLERRSRSRLTRTKRSSTFKREPRKGLSSFPRRNRLKGADRGPPRYNGGVLQDQIVRR